eukprot:comp17315_c0_seq1/m.29046 comp17315_c0_seq1/g.29046  ORF comp17315_c0_seq1/g.29046 comp17315_c0_seq1/m.29046 type:complete len:311 (-) comp17315_c0_seq1:8-940(-)
MEDEIEAEEPDAHVWDCKLEEPLDHEGHVAALDGLDCVGGEREHVLLHESDLESDKDEDLGKVPADAADADARGARVLWLVDEGWGKDKVEDVAQGEVVRVLYADALEGFLLGLWVAGGWPQTCDFVRVCCCDGLCFSVLGLGELVGLFLSSLVEMCLAQPAVLHGIGAELEREDCAGGDEHHSRERVRLVVVDHNDGQGEHIEQVCGVHGDACVLRDFLCREHLFDHQRHGHIQIQHEHRARARPVVRVARDLRHHAKVDQQPVLEHILPDQARIQRDQKQQPKNTKATIGRSTTVKQRNRRAVNNLHP